MMIACIGLGVAICVPLIVVADSLTFIVYGRDAWGNDGSGSHRTAAPGWRSTR